MIAIAKMEYKLNDMSIKVVLIVVLIYSKKYEWSIVLIIKKYHHINFKINVAAIALLN